MNPPGARVRHKQAGISRPSSSDAAPRMCSTVVRIAAMLVSVLLTGVSLVGCSGDNAFEALHVASAEVNGPGSVGMSASGQPVKAIAVFFHGADQTIAGLQDSAKHKGLFAPLLKAGFAVVAADAGGNAFGSLKSRADYRALIRAAETKYNAKTTVYVAESMGALAALALLSEDRDHQIKAMAGISPLMGLPPYIRGTTFIADQWNGHVPDAADPMAWPPSAFAGDRFRLYHAKQDNVIPRGATAYDFAKKFGGVAGVTVVDCDGQHVDASCYQGSDIGRWLGDLT